MQRVDRIAREALEQALLQHHASAAVAFFGGLEDEGHRAVECARARQLARRAEQHAGVAVVAAAVMRAGRAARMLALAELDHRQRIHVGAQAEAARARAAAQRRDHAGAGDAFVHVQPEQAQGVGDDAGGALFLERELRMRMQVAPQRDQLGQQVIDG